MKISVDTFMLMQATLLNERNADPFETARNQALRILAHNGVEMDSEDPPVDVSLTLAEKPLPAKKTSKKSV